MKYNELTEGTLAARVEFPDVPAKNMEIVTALMEDPNPIHFDRRAVEEMDWPGLINQGPINMAYVSQAALAVADSPTDVVSMSFRFESNVFEGEDVASTATVTDRYREDGDGYVELELALEKEDGDTPVSGTATVLVPLED